ncbi:MBL fold metallo-hydrolase [Ancylobacter terrae]|uniref:MBL fold metallo-hydrolase n=1 Tax=Ancylobacter sp. sgz301288 TaxID=3342077 RepID=UPI00385E7B9E
MTRKVDDAALSVTFWGVRGSTATPGRGTLAYGGNTTCLEIRAGDRRVILDAGSGIIGLGAALAGDPPQPIHIVLSHLHHDHIEGLFFFAPLFRPRTEIILYCGNLDGASAEVPLRRYYSPPLFPLRFEDVPASVRYVGFRAGETLDIGGMPVRTHPLRHPGGATGYRFDHAGRSVAVLTDHEHAGEAPEPDLVAFTRGCDLIAYDATFDDADYAGHRGWGHSTPSMGAALAEAAGAGGLACIHHAPQYDDARLDRMEAALRERLPTGFFAREGASVGFSPRSARRKP